MIFTVPCDVGWAEFHCIHNIDLVTFSDGILTFYGRFANVHVFSQASSTSRGLAEHMIK